MNKQQLHKRICPEAIARVLREWNDDKITTKMAMDELELSRPQLYRLRTKWLSRGKKKSIRIGVSGGDHSDAWPTECIEHLTKMLEHQYPESDRDVKNKKDRNNKKAFEALKKPELPSR